MRIMAIDYGDARTGIAVSDALGMIAGETFVIAQWDPEALAKAISALKNDPEGRTAMGLRGRRIAEEQFDRPVSYRRIIAMADRLLDVQREE